MASPYIRRLVLPAAMAAFLLLSLAYWWLENLPHEIFGTAMFVLLGWHVAVNRRWFGNLTRGRYGARRVVVVGLQLFLIVNMLILVGTSILISKSLLGSLPIPDSIYMRDVHWFSAYWLIIGVGIHLGLHWVRIMALTSVALKMPLQNAAIALTMRCGAMICAAFGLWSFAVLHVWAKLTFTFSIDVWNFRTSVTPFFFHWSGVLALLAVTTHYTMLWWRR